MRRRQLSCLHLADRNVFEFVLAQCISRYRILISPKPELPVDVGNRMIDTSLEAVNSIVEILSIISVPAAAAIDRLWPKTLLFAFDAKLL